MHRIRRIAPLAAALAVVALLPAVPAMAEPSTTVNYPADATTTRLIGKAFDTCNAPSLAAMQAWTASPYSGVGVYIGGNNRFCAEQPNLTASWVGQVSDDWKIIPIYLGRQAPCTFRTAPEPVYKISRTTSTARDQGNAAAADAIARANALHLRAGSAIYYDMEGYVQDDSSCRTAVLTFLSAWTKRLHSQGYVSGVYANLNQGAKQLSDAYTSTSYARSDALWIARYDGDPSLQNWTLVNGTSIPNTHWASGARAKQYQGGHNETHGGVTMNIDSNQFNAPVATVSHSYTVTTTTNPLSARTGPAYKYRVVKTHAPGAKVYVRCQITGQTVGTSPVWNKLNDGTYVPDYYVSTPSNTTFSPPLPRCLLIYQVNAPTKATKRTGPGSGYAIAGSLPAGALARVHCQATGSLFVNTRVWNKLDDGTWVTDHHVATPGSTGFSPPLPRCLTVP